MISRNNIQGKKGIGLRPILTMSWSIQYSLKLCHNAMNPYGQLWKMEVQRIELGLKAFNKTVPWQIHDFFGFDNFFPCTCKKCGHFCTQAIQNTAILKGDTNLLFQKSALFGNLISKICLLYIFWNFLWKKV